MRRLAAALAAVTLLAACAPNLRVPGIEDAEAWGHESTPRRSWPL